MDKQPAEIQRSIEQQRMLIGEKLVGLRERLQNDAGKTRLAWKRQSSRAGQQAWRGLAFTAGALGAVAALGVGYTAWRWAARRKGRGILSRRGRGILR